MTVIISVFRFRLRIHPLGFIALVVCLSLLVVGLCVGVYILLRDHLPTDEERAMRRQMSSRRHREQQQSTQLDTASTSPLTSNNANSMSAASPTSLTQRISGMFGMHPADDHYKKRRTKKGSRGGQGWVQASSGDEWDLEADSEVGPAQTRSLGPSVRLAERSAGGPVDAPFIPPQPIAPQPRYAQADSVSSIHDLVNISNRSSRTDEPYGTRSPTPSSSYHASRKSPPGLGLKTAPTRLQTADSLITSPTSSDAHGYGGEHDRAYNASPEPYTRGSQDHAGGRQIVGEERQDSGGSVSVRTFHTGTKFIESLE